MSHLTNINHPELFSHSNELFNQNWQIYRKILDHNYMRHREIASLINDFLVNYFHKSINVLDLGCGDATFSALALSQTKISSYQGVDLSPPALKLAEENMKIIPGEQIFIHSDFLTLVPELVQAQTETFDLILSSFALHHLSYDQKDALLSQIAHLLKDGGLFLLIDIVLKEQETREAYLNRYIADVSNNWHSLTPEELSLIEEHINTSDFPETQETFQLLAQKYHLRSESLYLNPLYTEQILAFKQ